MNYTRLYLNKKAICAELVCSILCCDISLFFQIFNESPKGFCMALRFIGKIRLERIRKDVVQSPTLNRISWQIKFLSDLFGQVLKTLKDGDWMENSLFGQLVLEKFLLT